MSGDSPLTGDEKRILTIEERRVINLLIKNGLADEKRMKALGDIVEASIAWGWMKKTLFQFGAASGAIAALVGLYHLFTKGGS